MDHAQRYGASTDVRQEQKWDKHTNIPHTKVWGKYKRQARADMGQEHKWSTHKDMG